MRLSCISFVLCLMAMPLCAAAQKKDDGKKGEEYRRSAVVKAYRTSVKSKDYSKAKQELDKALAAYPQAASDTKLYSYKMLALNELIKQENRKIYLNQKPDTTAYFKYVYELYDTGLRCDSIEQTQLAEDRAEGKNPKAKLRRELGNTMLAYRSNVVNAGKFYYRKKDYINAYKYFDLYLKTKDKRVFDSHDGGVATKDPDDKTSVSTLAVLSAYASSNYPCVMSHITESLKDTLVKSQIIEIGYKSAAAMNDSTSMLAFLQRGFKSYPEVEYFFMSLVRYYDGCNEYKLALETIEKMLSLYPDNRDYNYMRGKHLLELNMEDEAVAPFSKCLELEADDAESYSALGDIYLNKAQEAYMRFNLPLSDPLYAQRKKDIMNLYEKACSYYENARKYNENNHEMWLTGLRETYFKLNKGRELRALEKYK